LKHLLRQIQTDRASLVHGRLRSGDLNASPWHIDAVAGASTPSLPDFAATAIDVDSRVSNGIMEDVGGHVALATDAGRINGS
jgi:hypothetical protein